VSKENGSSKGIDRRRALQVIGAGLGSVGGLIVFGSAAGCKKEGEGSTTTETKPAATTTTTTTPTPEAAKPAGGGGCADKVAVDEQAAALRKAVQYKEKSDNPDKKCSTCIQFEAGKYGECGGCKLFAGGVNPEGFCLSWGPKAGAAPAPAPGGAPKDKEPAKKG